MSKYTPMKILIAEDDPFMATLIERVLTNKNFEVITATNGSEALKIATLENPDLIITDISMPITSGLELIKFVNSEFGKKIPIIVLSGMDEEATVLEAFELGAEDFLTKPFNPRELLIRVNRLLIKSSKEKHLSSLV